MSASHTPAAVDYAISRFYRILFRLVHEKNRIYKKMFISFNRWNAWN